MFAIGNKSHTTLVIAPTFKRVDDIRETGELIGEGNGTRKWKYGYDSQNEEVSSFHAMDELSKVFEKMNIFQRKKNISSGHSAGGQFVQRYSVGTEITTVKDKKIDLIVSNPSSYLYLHPQRVHFINN